MLRFYVCLQRGLQLLLIFLTIEHPVSQNIDKLQKVLKEVLDKNYAKLTKAMSDCMPQVADEMFARGLISEPVKDNPTTNSIVREFKAGMEFKKKSAQMKEHCDSFLTSLITQRGPAEQFARMIAEEWNEKILERLDFSINFTA